jgi:drug/metabolite transporter (DMT)-like permease
MTSVSANQQTIPSFSVRHATTLGVASGTGAAICWALGLVAARHGVNVGLSPLVIALHRYVWPALALLPVLFASGVADLGGTGWRRGFALAFFGGLPVALLSYFAYLFVPLGHGGVIQPACAALGGLLLARIILKERLPVGRIIGALTIVVGLCIIGFEAMRTIGVHGVGGDLMFVTAGAFFAMFGILVRLWRVNALRATMIISVLSLVALPFLLLKFDNMIAAGFRENLLQAVMQGGLTGVGGTFLFTRAVVLLGASRAILFPSLVPPFTILIGFLVLGEVPTIAQLVGLAAVVIGFRLTQMQKV